MRIVKLKKENLFPFLEVISKEADLWAPVKKYEDKHVFKAVEDFSEIDLDYQRTIIPPRRILLPPKTNMFEATQNTYKEDFSNVSKKIIFGIHACDVNALVIMDRFYNFAYDDPYYTRARENTLILGYSCWPDEHCLCKSTNTHIVTEGYDLFFSKLDTHYLVWIGSSQGDDLIRKQPSLFNEDISDKDIQTYLNWQKEREDAFQAEIDFIDMPDLIELKYNDPLWEELGKACLACGSCTNVCPTCNCYNVYDKPILGKNASKIVRCWDACTLENYSEVAGGENFRENRADRLKLWYTHKLQAYISKYGKPACVGCGRCIVSCPVDINVLTVGKTLSGEKVDAFWKRFNLQVKKEVRK
ncbi:MAG: 4Fe-4S dicluster domain-containing protein [Candidatus Aminicenantes bacterium]|nr:4Fe-4S dicluster domain-containing protein [Candidatus Aminicenantes bacterium]